MHLFAIMIAAQNPTDNKPYIYSREYNLSSFGYFVKNSVKESFKFLCRESLLALSKGTRHTVEHEKQYFVYIQVSSNSQLAAYAFCDTAYPRRIAFKMLAEAIQKFESEAGEKVVKYQTDENIDIGLSAVLKQYADPKSFDRLVSAQENADKITVTLHENIEKLVDRGQNLDKLVAKSNDLGIASKQFYKTSKKMDKCCNIF